MPPTSWWQHLGAIVAVQMPRIDNRWQLLKYLMNMWMHCLMHSQLCQRCTFSLFLTLPTAVSLSNWIIRATCCLVVFHSQANLQLSTCQPVILRLVFISQMGVALGEMWKCWCYAWFFSDLCVIVLPFWRLELPSLTLIEKKMMANGNVALITFPPHHCYQVRTRAEVGFMAWSMRDDDVMIVVGAADGH